MAVQPKFKRGKTYDGRRGRKKYEVTGITSNGVGKHVYNVVEHINGESKERTINEEVLLELARLRKKGDKVYLSASQVDTFRRCKRKWAFTYIDGEIAPSSPAQEFGTEVHTVLEKYLKTGNWQGATDAVACAKQGEHLLPPPRDKTLGIEQQFTIDLDSQSLFLGFIDLVIPTRKGNPLEVTDHKTTKDLRYAATSDELRDNVQANLYAKWAMDQHRTNKVLTRWRYYCSRPSKAKAADVNGRPRNMGGFRAITRVKTDIEVQEQWNKLVEDAKEMVTFVRDKKVWAKDVEGNEAACGDYGGCPFRGLCGVGQDSLGSLVAHSNKVSHTKKEKAKEQVMSLMDIINKNKSKTAETPTNESLPQEPAKEPAKKSALELAAERALAERQKQDGAKGVNPPPVEEQPLAPELEEAAKPVVPQAWKDRLSKGHKPRAEGEAEWRAEQLKADAPIAPEKEAIAPEPASIAPEPATEKAGFDPSQVEVKADGKTVEGLGEVEATVESEPKVVVPKGSGKGKSNGTSLDKSFVLMVDCWPAKMAVNSFGVRTLAEVLRPMKDAVQEMKDVPYWNLVKYREGETLLAACTEQAWRGDDRPEGIVLADSFSSEWKAVGDIATELADIVVRGK